MREALFGVAVLASLAAALRTRAMAGTPLALSGFVLSFGAFVALAFAPISPALRFAFGVYGVAALGKTLALGRRPRGPRSFRHRILYLAFWPGLDPAKAFTRDASADRARNFRAAGIGLLEVAAAFVVSGIASRSGLLALAEPIPAWIRAGAFVLMIDGAFRAAMGALGAAGMRHEEVFCEPWRMSDLADFWGRRWNRFVGDTLAVEVFRPLALHLGRGGAVLLTFFMSGVLHEVLLGVAANAPDGRYMAFFLAQGVAVLVSSALFPGRGRGVGSRLGRRLAAWGALLATAPLFFGGPYAAVLPLERILP